MLRWQADATAHRSWIAQVAGSITSTPTWEEEVSMEIGRACTANRLAVRFRRPLQRLLQRRLLFGEVEAISCELRRWRLGYRAACGELDPKTGQVYRPRGVREPPREGAAHQPPESHSEWCIGLPQLVRQGIGGRCVFEMCFSPLDEFAPA